MIRCYSAYYYRMLPFAKDAFQVRFVTRTNTSSFGYITKLGIVRETSAWIGNSSIGLPDAVSALISKSLRVSMRNTFISYKANSRPLHC